MIPLRAVARLVVLSLPAMAAAQTAPAPAPPSAPPSATVQSPDSQTTAPAATPAPDSAQTSAPAATQTPPQEAAKPAVESDLSVAVSASNYSGYVGQSTAHFTMTGAADGTVKGSYFLDPDQKPVAFEGRAIDATSFSARTSDPEHPYLYLKVDKSEALPKMAGAVYSQGSASSQPVSLNADPPAAKPVNVAKVTEAAAAPDDAANVEANAKAFLQAVKTGDVQRASSLVAFPIAYTSRGRRTLIHDDADFQKRFKTIFSTVYLARLQHLQEQPLEATPEGLKLGPGEVWFNEEGKAFALNNEPVKMFAGKKFLSNAGYTGAAPTKPPAKPKPPASAAGNATGSTAGSVSNGSDATPGQRPAQGRRRRRHGSQAG